MTPWEKAILDLCKAGLARDNVSVRRVGRRLLDRLPPEMSTGFRAELGMLLTAGESTSLFRAVEAGPLPGVRAVIEPEPGPRSEPLFNPDDRRVVHSLLLERTNSAALMEAGLRPISTALLVGPPGVGKTMTAHFLADQLGLPLVTVDLSAVMSSYLGKTAQNLSGLLAEARGRPCVFFIDEFDALGKRRDDPADIGELKRIVNVLLVELDTWPSQGLLLAATNHPELLDRAIWRRFDRIIELGLPDVRTRADIIEHVFRGFSVPAKSDHVELAAVLFEGSSGSDLNRECMQALRAVVLGEEIDAAEALLHSALTSFRRTNSGDPELRQRVVVTLSESGHSQRRIADLLEVSPMTVSRDLRVHHGKGGE